MPVRCLAIAALSRFAGEIARDLAEPRTQPSGFAQLTELAPRSDERVLRHVLAKGPVAGRAIRDRTHHILVTADEKTERIAFTAAAGFLQLSICSRDVSHVLHWCSCGPQRPDKENAVVSQTGGM